MSTCTIELRCCIWRRNVLFMFVVFFQFSYIYVLALYKLSCSPKSEVGQRPLWYLVGHLEQNQMATHACTYFVLSIYKPQRRTMDLVCHHLETIWQEKTTRETSQVVERRPGQILERHELPDDSTRQAKLETACWGLVVDVVLRFRRDKLQSHYFNTSPAIATKMLVCFAVQCAPWVDV